MFLKNKKGFTLLEMMIVIAVIAILVAVVIPILTGSTDKAAAATNAANLRSVEGEVVTAMLLNPATFGDQAGKQAQVDQDRTDLELEATGIETLQAAVTTAQTLVDNLTTTLNSLNQALDEAEKTYNEADFDTLVANAESAKNAATCNNPIRTCGTRWTDYGHSVTCNITLQTAAYDAAILARDEGYKLVEAAQNAVTAGEQELADAQKDLEDAQKNLADAEAANQKEQDNLAQTEAEIYSFTAENGIITLPDGSTINAPASKEMNLDGIAIDEGVEMTVYVNVADRTATAHYNGLYNSDFAGVADNE